MQKIYRNANFLFLLLLIGSWFLWVTVGKKSIGLPTSNADPVRSALRSFDQGILSLDDVFRNGDEGWCRRVVDFYLTNSSEVSLKSKLPVSLCFMVLSRDAEAGKLASDYVTVYSNDWHGWKVLGGASAGTTNFAASVDAYMQACILGCEHGCLIQLCGAALADGRVAIIRPTIPRLLELKHGNASLGDDPQDALAILLGYSLEAADEETLIKTLDGVRKSDLFSREDLKGLVTQACVEFKSDKAQKVFRDLGIEAQPASK